MTTAARCPTTFDDDSQMWIVSDPRTCFSRWNTLCQVGVEKILRMVRMSRG
jgi:hypothetical protein